MKKGLLIVCALCIAGAGISQVRFGVKAGINIANQTNAYETAVPGTQQTVLLDGNPIVHLNGGVFTEISVARHVLFRPQLIVTSTGFKSGDRYDMLGNNISNERKYTLNYINLPLQFLYSFNLKVGKAWIGTGPYLGTLVNGYYRAISGKLKINVGNGKDDEFKSFDAGISSSAGLTMTNGFLFCIEQNTGLMDVTTGTNTGNSRNIIWSFCIGYLIK